MGLENWRWLEHRGVALLLCRLATLTSRPQAPSHNPGLLTVVLPDSPGYALYPSAQVAQETGIMGGARGREVSVG